jgi:hypothetical protein
VLVLFGMVKDEGFILILALPLLRLLLALHPQLFLGVLMEETPSRHIIPLPDTGSCVEDRCEFILLLLFLLRLPLPLLLGVNIGQKNGQRVGLSTLTATARLVLP